MAKKKTKDFFPGGLFGDGGISKLPADTKPGKTFDVGKPGKPSSNFGPRGFGGGGSSGGSGSSKPKPRGSGSTSGISSTELARLKRQQQIDELSLRQKEVRREIARANKPRGTVTATPQLRGLEKLDADLRRKRRKLIGKNTIGSQAVGVGLGFGSALLGTALFVKAVRKDPVGTAKNIPNSFRRARTFVTSGELARVLREEPGFVTGAVAGELFISKGGQVVIVRGGRLGGSVATRLGPGFRRVRTIKTPSGLQRVIKNLKSIGGRGQLRIIKSGKGPKKVKGRRTLPSVRGGFGFSKKEQKAILKRKGSGPTVSSAQNLFGTLRRRKVKIKPGKEQKKFGFFGTPPVDRIGFVRESRLGLGQKTGRFRDLFSGDVTFGKVKPQIVVVPKSKGFKGTGFKSSELETTLKPGLILKKTGRAGTTVLGKGVGQRVPIILAKVVKAPKKVSALFKKASRGVKLTAKESKLIKKATGFSPSQLSRTFATSRRVSPSGLVGSRVRSRAGSSRRTTVRGRTVPGSRISVRTTVRRASPVRRGSGSSPRPRPRPRTRTPVRRRVIRSVVKRPVARKRVIRRTIRPPTRPRVPLRVQEALQRIKKKKKKKVRRSDIALVQGFTSKALGLKPIKITRANLKRRIKQFQTVGLRRRPVFVRKKKR